MLFASCTDKSKRKYAASETATDKVEVVEAPPAEATVSTEVETAPGDVSEKLTSLHSETDIEKLLCQGWAMDDDIEILENNNAPEGAYTYRSFYFFDDHTYTRNIRNYMEYGTWLYNDRNKTFSLRRNDGYRDEYKIAAIGANDMIILNNKNHSSTKLTYLSSGFRYRNKQDDPFYIDNNRWRIKPGYSESNEEIRERLKQWMHFFILLYKNNLDRKEDIISFYGFPTCVKWYGGGMGMIKENELPDNWFACFYNKEQAIKAYNMVDDLMAKKYKWGKASENWVKRNLAVLEQVYANL